MTLLRCLGIKEALSIVVGSVIGTGVFLKTAVMAQQTGSPVFVLLAWIVAGALSLMGAIAYSELGSRFPAAGGEYVYLREAYGPLAGFLYGWTRFWVVTPASIAAYAIGTAVFLNGVLPLGDHRLTAAISMIILFTLLNCFAVSIGGFVQNALTALKSLMIVGLTLAIFFGSAGATFGNFGGGSGWKGWSGFGAAVLAALWAFDGWNNLPMAAGEIQEPERVIPRALTWGMLLVLFIYAGVNLAYFYALPFAEILSASSTLYPDALPVAAKAASTVFGPAAVGLLSVAFVISALGAMNGSILTGARVPFAMARDGLFFSWLGRLSPVTRVPVTSVLTQGAWACVLATSGTFDQLTDCVVFASWIFYALNMYGLFLFRRRLKPASFQTPLWAPIVFLVCAVLLLANTLWTIPRESLLGLGLIALGVPAFAFFKRHRERARG
jgi:APA family basic amino acid/polyamine antiporter